MTRMIGVWETQEAIRFDETIPARVAAVGPVVERVMAVVEHAGCVPDKAHDVDLAVREAVTNAVIHGSREDPEKEVHISVSCDVSGDVHVTVRDTGMCSIPRRSPTRAPVGVSTDRTVEVSF